MNHQGYFRIFLVFFIAAFYWGCSGTATSFSLPQKDDSFNGQVFYNNKVDILFVVDNSPSMLQYQQRLSAKVNDMISTLNSLGMDYRVAVTSTSMTSNSSSACFPVSRKIIGSPAYLTKSNINQLTSRIIVGESGCEVERGLDSMRYVTSASYLSSINSDFIRTDALFTVIFISDEIDQSSEFGNPDRDDFLNYLNTFKPIFENGARAWIANYIGILTNQSCDNLGGYVSIGTQFIKLVDASNGVKTSICNPDLSVAVSNIKARIVDQITQRRFKDVPNKSTIQVTVGGRSIPEDVVNGWTLETEGSGNSIVYILKFHGTAIPAANQQVNITYKPAGVS